MKTVVITGSTKGIGYGLALHLLKLKHQVVINGRKEEDVQKITKELLAKGYDVLGIAGDVKDSRTFYRIIEKTVACYKKLIFGSITRGLHSLC